MADTRVIKNRYEKWSAQEFHTPGFFRLNIDRDTWIVRQDEARRSKARQGMCVRACVRACVRGVGEGAEGG